MTEIAGQKGVWLFLFAKAINYEKNIIYTFTSLEEFSAH
jgi:hypothetical protein